MLKNLFKKKKTQEEIEHAIIEEIDKIKKNSSPGRRDFSKLKNLDEEIFLSESMDIIQSNLFLEMIKEAEDIMWNNFYDVQNVIDILKDITTLTFNACAFQGKKLLLHEKLFEKKPERLYSCLLSNENIEKQFNEIKNNEKEYRDAAIEILQRTVKAREAYEKRDEFGIDHLPQRLSIISNYMMCDVSEEVILKAKKAILSTALSGDLKFNYLVCRIDFFERYFAERNEDYVRVPTTDMLIADAIIEAYSYKDPELANYKIDNMDIKKNVELFVKEYGNYIEMKDQFRLLNQVYEYLRLDIRVPEITSDIARTRDRKKICIYCENKHLDKEKDMHFCDIHGCFVDAENTCNKFREWSIDLNGMANAYLN